MNDRYRRMSDEDIERLLQRAERRMPSPELWQRLAAKADRRASRRAVPWIPAAAAVLILAVLGLALFTSDGPAPQQLPERSPAAITRAAVTPPSPAPQPGTQHPTPAPAVTRAPEPQPVRQPPVARQVKRVPPPPTAAVPDVAVRPEAPSISAPVAAEQTAVASVRPDTRREIPESSYYIKVSRGETSSVIEGSVTHSSSGDPKEIRIAYDTNAPRMNGAN